MASRVRSNATSLFDVFYVFGYALDENGEPVINVIKKYPSYIEDNISLTAVKSFCFPKAPGDWSEKDPVSFFTFTITNEQGLFTFGHCRFSPSKRSTMCFLSALPDIAFFKYTLGYLAIALQDQVDPCLALLYTHLMPLGEETIKFADLGFNVSVRDFKKYFSSFSDMEVLMLYNAVEFSPNQLICLYASLLRERRIILTSSRLETLTCCVFGALKLIYPFHWQGIFIPILTYGIAAQMMAPMPYIMGIPKETLARVGDLSEYGELTILDLDEHTFTCDTDDSLPFPVVKYIAKQLKPGQNNTVMSPEILIRAFMKANILIFGRYRNGLSKAESNQESKITWDKQRFLDAQPPELRSFVQLLVCEEGAQYFERFVDERVAELNNGHGCNEEFDRSLRNVDVYYQEALDASRNFKDSLQDVVSGVKSSTNAVFGTLKDSVQQGLKRKTKSNSKHKKLPSPAYSFVPPILPSPDKPLPDLKDLQVKERESPTPIRSPSPDIHLMHFDNDDMLLGSIAPRESKNQEAHLGAQSTTSSFQTAFNSANERPMQANKHELHSSPIPNRSESKNQDLLQEILTTRSASSSSQSGTSNDRMSFHSLNVATNPFHKLMNEPLPDLPLLYSSTNPFTSPQLSEPKMAPPSRDHWETFD